MTKREQDRIRTLLKQTLTPIGDDLEPDSMPDLWPEFERRLHQARQAGLRPAIPWFDWVLAAGVAIVAVAFPASIPVLLYYL